MSVATRLSVRFFFIKWFKFSYFVEPESFWEIIQRLQKSQIGMDKIVAPCFRKCPDQLPRPAAFEIWVVFKIVIIEFLETDFKLKWSTWIIWS